MTEEPPHLLIDEQEGILIATFNRPDKLNAMSNQLTFAACGDADGPFSRHCQNSRSC